MEIFKVILLGILGALIVVLLRGTKPEFAVLATIATGAVMVIFLVTSLNRAVETFTELVERTGLSEALFAGVLKIIGVGYLTEYSASICSDAGCEFIASKVNLAGKIVIFLMSISIIRALIDVIDTLIHLQQAL